MASNLAGPGYLLATRGAAHALGAWVIGLSFDRAGTIAAFALGDGTIRLLPAATPQETPRSITAHDGACLSFAADIGPGAFLSGGDDGRLVRIDAGAGSAATLYEKPGRWIEHVAAHPAEKGKGGWRAAATGKLVLLFGPDAAAGPAKTMQHPSTVGGIAFDPRGRRIAVAHYGGVSLWWTQAKEDKPRLLPWKGSHLAVAVSPDGDHVVTAMQENALHGWRLSDMADMRMSGYPAKTRALAFTAKGKWLATSGAEAVVCWPFTGGGPMGKPPKELAGGDAVLCSMVAAHPQHEVVAAGFADGMVLLVDIGSGRVVPVAEGGQGAVSALGWSPDGARLAFGTEQGFAGVVDFARR
ncbi:MAG: WD40 repeat domain-containing protein [Alphaproteobacteria bacterium]|nr:WD40 repeat domain-containing protein [Alphaproteobacteria bacterium]